MIVSKLMKSNELKEMQKKDVHYWSSYVYLLMILL